MEPQLFTIVKEQQSYDRIYVIWILRIGSTGPWVVCYWNISEVKEAKLKYTMKERTRKTSQTMQLNKQIRWRKLNRTKIQNTNKIKEVEIMKNNNTNKQ